MCRFIDNFMDIQSNAVTTDESIVLKLAEDVYFLVLRFLFFCISKFKNRQYKYIQNLLIIY